MSEKSKLWWKAAGVRAVKTFAEAAIVALPTTAFMVGSVDWIAVASMGLGSAILSLLASIAGLPEVKLEEAKLPDESVE